MKNINDIKVGDEFYLEKEIDKYRPIYYAGASGDFNPIHIDPEFGRIVGLDGIILHGLCTMAYVCQLNTDWIGDPGAIKKLKVRFVKPVRPDDIIKVSGKVIEKEGNRVKCTLVATNQNGVEVIDKAFSEIKL